MKVKIKVPRLGLTVEDAVVMEWHKKVGDAVEARVEGDLRERFPEGPGGVDPQRGDCVGDMLLVAETGN